MIIRKGEVGGGIERASSFMANCISSRGVDVYLVSIYKTDVVFKVNSSVKNMYLKYNERETSFIRFMKLVKDIRKVIMKVRPSVVLSYGETVNPAVIISSIGLKTPLVISDRLSPSFSLGFSYDLIRRIVYRFASGCIFQTKIAQEMMLSKIKIKNSVVIPNPVNEINCSIVEKRNVIVTVGRVSPEKGQNYLIEAFARIQDKSWILKIIGGYNQESDYYKYLQSQIKKYDISERVIFYGRMEDFSCEMSSSKIFVLPSISEGFPNALIEAMSVPLACISFNCIAGPRDIIKNGENGLLVPSKNVDALYLAMQSLIDNESLRDKLAKNAFDIRKKLSRDRIVSQYLDYLISFVKK